MRILILNWRDIKHPFAGGAEISTHEHAKRWVNEGHLVTQFSSTIEGENSEEIIDGVRIIRIGSHYTVHLHAFLYYMKHLRGNVDLIVDEFHFIPFLTPLYTRTKKLAFIHETARQLWFENQPFPISAIGFLLEPLFFRLYKNTIFMTVSQSTKEDLIKFGIKEKKIFVVNNGINVKKSTIIKEKKPIVMYLGKLVKDKGVKDAIYAFNKIQKIVKNSFLWIVGKEEVKGYQKKIEKIVKDLKLQKKVVFWGYASEKNKFDLLKRASLLIHPSVKEGWGLTVIEAASQGTPTVSYEIGGLKDAILDKETGLLTKDKDINKLADNVIMLLKNRSLYNRLSKNAVSWSKKFDWGKSTQKSLKLVEGIYGSYF